MLDAYAPFLPPRVPALPALSSAASSLGPFLDYSCVWEVLLSALHSCHIQWPNTPPNPGNRTLELLKCTHSEVLSNGGPSDETTHHSRAPSRVPSMPSYGSDWGRCHRYLPVNITKPVPQFHKGRPTALSITSHQRLLASH